MQTKFFPSLNQIMFDFFKQIEETEAEVVEPTKEELPFTFKGKFEPPTFYPLIHVKKASWWHWKMKFANSGIWIPIDLLTAFCF